MARGTPTQTNFNGGEISRRLHARHDLNLYGIALASCIGWIPTVEGGLDAMPGTIRIAEAAGPCRLMPFIYSTTQSYIVEMSAGKARFYTNGARIEDDGAPIELALPYDMAAIGALSYEQSFDVLYLFHGQHRPRALIRTDADAFELDPVELVNGPFDSLNEDKSILVSASGVAGDVQLKAAQSGAPYPLFTPTDVGSLFQLEASDFGDITAWQPNITVTTGQLLTWNERVYAVVGGTGRTGGLQPEHSEGVEWDGIGQGQDYNDKAAGGVQLEYLHDRFGVLRITGFVDTATVNATVLRRLPFTASSGGYGA